MNLDKQVRKLKNLPNFKDKSDEEIEKIIKENNEQEEILGSLTFCINEEEKKFAKHLLKNYLTQSSFEHFSEKQTLGQLIDQELLAKRMKDSLKTQYESANSSIPLQMVEQLDSVIERIEELQNKLGLMKKDEKNDASKVIDDLLTRFHKWVNMPENRSNYEFQCPSCEEIFLLRRRLDKEKDEVVSHPFYISGGILLNKEIFIDLEAGRISEDQARRYLNATIDYIHWIRQNYPLSQDKENTEQND